MSIIRPCKFEDFTRAIKSRIVDNLPGAKDSSVFLTLDPFAEAPNDAVGSDPFHYPIGFALTNAMFDDQHNEGTGVAFLSIRPADFVIVLHSRNQQDRAQRAHFMLEDANGLYHCAREICKLFSGKNLSHPDYEGDLICFDQIFPVRIDTGPESTRGGILAIHFRTAIHLDVGIQPSSLPPVLG